MVISRLLTDKEMDVEFFAAFAGHGRVAVRAPRAARAAVACSPAFLLSCSPVSLLSCFPVCVCVLKQVSAPPPRLGPEERSSLLSVPIPERLFAHIFLVLAPRETHAESEPHLYLSMRYIQKSTTFLCRAPVLFSTPCRFNTYFISHLNRVALFRLFYFAYVHRQHVLLIASPRGS